MKDHKKTGRQETNVMFFFYSFVQTITTRSKHGLPNFIRTGYEALDSPCTDYMPLPQKKRKIVSFLFLEGKRPVCARATERARACNVHIIVFHKIYTLVHISALLYKVFS